MKLEKMLLLSTLITTDLKIYQHIINYCYLFRTGTSLQNCLRELEFKTLCQTKYAVNTYVHNFKLYSWHEHTSAFNELVPCAKSRQYTNFRIHISFESRFQNRLGAQVQTYEISKILPRKYWTSNDSSTSDRNQKNIYTV